MRALFIHIGMHKTGTTSIQWYLSRHRRKLKGYGYYVPRSGCVSRAFAGHHNVAWSLLEDGRADAQWGALDELLAELNRANPPRAVISAEDLEFLADRPRRLMAFEARIVAAGWAPTYVLFLRSPGSYSLSVFQELQRNRQPVPFPDFHDRMLERGFFASRNNLVLHLDYDLFVAKWRAAAKGELKICSYDDAAAGAGVVPQFMAAIGAPAQLGQLRQARFNVTTRDVSETMRAGARRIAVKYEEMFLRHTSRS